VEIEEASRTAGAGRERAAHIALGLVLATLMVLPALVAIAALAGRPWYPVSDLAIINLRVRDVWTVDTPLTGLWSRFGWNHPGPLMFWFMRGLAAGTGGAPWATRIAGPLLQGVALGWLAWVTWRRDLRTLLAAATVTALTCVAISPQVFRVPWNLYVPLPFLLLFLFLTYLVACGSFRQLIAMSVVATFVVQTHVGYAPLLVAGFAFALAATVKDVKVDRHPPDRWRSTLIISGAVWLLTWIPIGVDAVVNPPGNFAKIVEYFFRGEETTVGIVPALGIMASEYHFVPPWLGGTESFNPWVDDAVHVVPSSLWWLLVPGMLLVLGFVAASRTHSREDARLVALAATMFVVAVLAISRADGARAYTFIWRIVIATFVVVACIWAIARLAEPHAPRVLRVAAVFGVVGVVAWGNVGFAISIPSARPYGGLEQRESALRQTMAQLRKAGLPKDQVVLAMAVGPGLPSLHRGVVDQLDREGVDVRVIPKLGRVFGTNRTAGPTDADAIWYVVERGSYARRFLELPGARVIAATTPLDATEEAELEAGQRRLATELRDARRLDLREHLDSSFVALVLRGVPGVDQATARRVADLNDAVDRAEGCRCSVIAVPAS